MVDNKRGVGGLIGIVILAIVALALFAVFYDNSGGFTGTSFSAVKFGDALGQPELNFVSYIVGGIPQLLIDVTSDISAAIIIVALFVMFLVIFSDILNLFGTFSKPAVGYLVAFVLTLIIANLKVIAYVGFFAMSLTAGLGIAAATIGIAVPFIVFIGIHWMFGSNFVQYWRGRKNAEQFRQGADQLTQGVEGIKAFGRAVRGNDDGTVGVAPRR